MGTTKRRQTKRNDSRQTALAFLTNITLGNELEIQKLSTIDSTVIESPTKHDDCISPTATANKITASTVKYGALSDTSNVAAKGIALDSSDSNSTVDEQAAPQLTIDTSSNRNIYRNEYSSSENLIPTSTSTGAEKRRIRRVSTSTSSNASNRRRFSSSSSSNSSEVIHQYKLTREDSERPIASEKIKKRSDHQDKNSETGSTGFMSVFRYYKGFIRQPRRRSENPYLHNGHNHHIYYHSYFQQHSANLHVKHRKALSYSHFLSTRALKADQVAPNCTSSSDEATTSANLFKSPADRMLPIVDYDPHCFDNENFISTSSSTQNYVTTKNNSKKKELNESFRKKHPEIPSEVTLSKVNAIKTHLLNIGKAMDLEISSISHAFVYFEKLIQKQIVNKQNRKLVAACCLFLATKVNEPKGPWFESLLEAIHSELNISPKDVRNHEFAIFADLEFNLYVPLQEFMPHFDKIFDTSEYKSIEEYIGGELFYKTMDNGYEIIGCASPTQSL